MFRPLLVATLSGLFAAAPLASQSPRIHTDRPTGKQLLKLPKADDAFGFVVFGDRTGGPVEGIKVLDQAVIDTNMLDPDLVFTVGDLINGYNGQQEWMAQAAEFKTSMARLRMPWFPVAGNHDIYWRGAGKPDGEHEHNFEAEFGPLWYAVQHKQCWFIALYSDEGDPKTGEKNFNKPECQRMSPAQFAWLEQTLLTTKAARHVFVFLHHPRWLKKYGDDWERVHALLAQSGNVSAVFAGHIHRMRFDGAIDGIQYYTVASVGAHLGMDAPQAGYLHQFHVVTVRPEGIVVGALPVGAVMDPQQITGQVSDDVGLLDATLRPVLLSCEAVDAGSAIDTDGRVDALTTLSFANPTGRPIDIEVVPLVDESWTLTPDHQHLVVPPKGKATTTFHLAREPNPEQPFMLPRLQVRCDYLAKTSRIGIPVREHDLALPPPAALGTSPSAHEGVLVLDGRGACLQVPSARLQLPEGPLTLELWLCGDDYTGRRAVLAKSESSEFCLFCSDGQPEFSVFLGKSYVTVRGAAGMLRPDQWQHFAGVYDGAELRCYLDGKLIGRQAGNGARKTNALPLFLGADPDGRGNPMSFFDGKVDEIRISRIARYAGAAFEPPRRHQRDPDTVLLLHCDADFGPWTADSSPAAAHPRRRGTAHCTVESRPNMR